MSDNEDAIQKLHDFIDDYKSMAPSDVANAYGIPRTIAGNGAVLLRKLGFDLGERAKSGGHKPTFNTAEAERLFDLSVDPKEIAAHLGVKTVSVTAYLKRIGKIKEHVPLAQALKGDVTKAA